MSLAYIVVMGGAFDADDTEKIKMKTKYTATFSNGTVLNRNSERAYKFAFITFCDKSGEVGFKGFSATFDGAKKEAVSNARYGCGTYEIVEAVPA